MFLYFVQLRIAKVKRIHSHGNTSTFSENRVNTVKNVNVFEDKPIPPENCALTLYFADKGEKLWDIAKSHNTKLDLLLSENSAENQVLDAPKMLLIPRI